jgi:hypothetical protein
MFVQHSIYMLMQFLKGLLTACMRAPVPPVLFVTATALPLISELDFCLFTTIWDDPKDFEAGRFAADILLKLLLGRAKGKNLRVVTMGASTIQC